MSLTLKNTCFVSLITVMLSLVFCVESFAQQPAITSFSPTTVCQGELVTITGTNFTGATSVQLGNVAAKNFTVNNATTITATVADDAATGKISVTTPGGSVASQNPLTINATPTPNLSDKSTLDIPFTNCDGNKNYTLVVENTSVPAGGSCAYDIDWGDGTTHFIQKDWPVGAQTSHPYTSQGYFSLKLTITPANGCKKQKVINFYNGANPLANFSTLYPTTSMCADTVVTFTVGDWFKNTPGTYYHVIFDDGSDTTLQHPLNLTDTVHWVKHKYTTSSCPKQDYTAILDAINGCYTKEYTQNQIVVRIKPKAGFEVQQSACVNETVCFDNITSNGYSGTSCNTNTNYSWDFGDGQTSDRENPGCHSYTNPGTYTVKLSASNTACGVDEITKTITVKPTSPPPTVQPGPITYCQNETAVQLSATGTNLLWYATSTGGIGSPTAPTPNTSLPGTKTYYVSQTVSGQCESPRAAITVTVNPLPAAPKVTSPVTLCKGAPAMPLTATGSNLLWYIAASDGTGSTTAPTPSTNNIGATYYYVSQTVNNCEGPRAKIEVNVNYKPAAPTVISPVTYCQNQPAKPLTATGTNLLWYTTATGGTGSTTAPTPSTSVSGATTYYVSQSNYCGESPRAAIKVDVFAGPSATIAYSPASLCNAPTAADVAVTITGDKTGSFSISPSGMQINPATGAISPANAAAKTYTITYTINASGGCSQFKTSTTVTVSSTPNAAISYPEICSSVSSVSPVITGTQGGTFSSDAGLIIDKTTGIISPGTSTVGTHTVKYSIAASPPCPGFEASATVAITKAPTASVNYNPSTLCNTKNAPDVNVSHTGDNNGAYTIQPAGLTIDAATGRLSPANAQPGNYIITYTIPASGGCAELKATTTVLVSDKPSASIQYPPICSSDGVVNAAIEGTKGGSFSSGTGLIIDAATGAINASASTPGTYTVKYSIAASPPCPAFDTTVKVTVAKAPSAAISYQPADLCNFNDASNAPVAVILTGDAGGIFSIQPTSLSINSNTGEIKPAGASPGVYTITYTLKGTGGCKDFSVTTQATIHSTPSAAIQYTGSPYCGNLSSATVILTGNSGGTFSSTTGLMIDANTGTINPSLSTPGIYTVKYSIAASPPCPAFDATTQVEISQSPVITFPVSSQEACSGETAMFKPTSTLSNTTYNWRVEGTLPPNITGVTSGTANGRDAVINLLFTNSGTTSQTITIKVTPTNITQNLCGGNAATITLKVNPVPAKLNDDTAEICMHAAPVTLSATSGAGNTIKWYDENNNLLNGAPVINTTNPAAFIFYATQVTASGCESPKAEFVAIVHPTAKIIGSAFTNPTSCGIPSGSIMLQVVDLNDNQLPNTPVTIHYTKYQTPLSMKGATDATGRIVMPLTAGVYSEIYVETYSCPSNTISTVFELKDPTPPSKPIAGYNDPVCTESVLNLSASSNTSSAPGALNYIWVGPAFGAEQDTTQNTVISFPSASTAYNGTYIVYAMQNNCISPATSFPVVINQSPVKPVINTKTPLCVGDDLNLQAYSSIPGNSTLNFTWNGPGTGFPVNAANAGIQNVQITDGGVYTVSVTSAETGCTASTDTLVQIGGYPAVKFPQDSLNVPTGYVFTLTPNIVNASSPNITPISKYEWTSTDNIVCNDAVCSNPTITIKNNVCYSVKATNIYGCSGGDTICITAFCKNAQVFVPNAFTPNGLAANAKFMVRASGVASVKSFRVFNRWGRIVFERNNFSPNDPSYAWDGKINGKDADMGVYVYAVEVTCENGTPYFYKGNVTLIR